MIEPCNGSFAQLFRYDRAQQTITHISGRCLAVQNANPAAGAPAVLWDCDGTDSQRWTYNPRVGVVTNALGNVLDVQWGNLTAGSLVWTWPRNEGDAQRFWADQQFTFSPTPPSSCGVLRANEGLLPGASAWSCDGRVILSNNLSSQGNTTLVQVITYNPPPPPPSPSGTNAQRWALFYYNFPGILVMQGDGNLVIYDTLGGAPVWSSNTWGNPGAYLELNNAGFMRILSSGGGELWRSN